MVLREAASALADDIFQRLLTVLGGYPIALEVVLPNLATQTPDEVLTVLQDGDTRLDRGDTGDKTRSLHQCVRYSVDQLPDDAHSYYHNALDLSKEFDDRHEQAGTYHQLGMIVQEQRDFDQARSCYKTALSIFVGYDDVHKTSIVLRSLARLWAETGDDAIPALVADVLEWEREEAEALLRRFRDSSEADDDGGDVVPAE